MARPSLPALRRRILAGRRSIAALDRSLKRLAVALRSARARRRPPKLSPRARASLKLQGHYMTYMRQLKPMQKGLVRAVLAKHGKKAAIRKAQILAGKRKAA